MIGFQTLFYKEILRFWKVATQTLTAPIVTAMLYLLIFGHVLEDHVQVYPGVPYTAFLVPGLVMMLHKPLGMTCSRKEDGALVYDVLPGRWQQRDPAISTIGRLDKATTGLLLLTDDGDLLHRVISPKRHVAKVYRATLARPLDGSEGEVFAAGGLVLEGEDKPLSPAVLEVLSPTEARLTVTEGRYHMVRRMFAAVGNHVEGLHRERVGGLVLPDDLAPGYWRLLDSAQIDAIFAP